MGRRPRGDPPHGLVRLVLAVGLGALTALVAPATAGAHIRSARTAVDYRADVSTAPTGVTAHVYPADLALGLTVAPGHHAVVLGYVGEPAIRVGDAGVEVNESSPTAAGTGLVKRQTGQAAGAPSWQLISSRPKVVWHDARVRGLPPGVTRRHWTVPLVVDGERRSIVGELVRVPRPSVLPWLALGALSAVMVAFVLARRRSLIRTATTALGLVAAAATVVTAADFAFASSANEGAWVEGANELVFVLVGLAFVIWGSSDTRALAGGALGLLALAVGLSKLPTLTHGIVLSALPGQLSRTAVSVAICAGGAAVVLGVFVFFDVLEHHEEPADLQARF
jgi:hypothetical protein